MKSENGVGGNVKMTLAISFKNEINRKCQKQKNSAAYTLAHTYSGVRLYLKLYSWANYNHLLRDVFSCKCYL